MPKKSNSQLSLQRYGYKAGNTILYHPRVQSLVCKTMQRTTVFFLFSSLSGNQIPSYILNVITEGKLI